MRRFRVAEQYGATSSDYLTGDVARSLELTNEGVRKLVRDDQLHPRRTPKGWRVFSKHEVLYLVRKRGEARLRGVTRYRAKKIGVRGEPHQLTLFGPKLVGKCQLDQS